MQVQETIPLLIFRVFRYLILKEIASKVRVALARMLSNK